MVDCPAAAESTPGQVTLSVVSHRQGTLVAQLLADVALIAPGTIARVIVTHNLPEPPIALPAGLRCPVVQVDNPSPRGFGANHNAAFGHCDTEWFAVVNPDIRLRENPFAPMLAAGGPRIGLIAPRVLEPDGRTADSARTLPTPWNLLARRLARTGADEIDPEWFAGMFLLVRSDAMRQIGGFDERYHLYCEDVDLCARLRLAGWELNRAEAARVAHDARRESHRSARHLGWHLASLFRLWTSSAYWRYRELLAGERRARAVPRASQG
jgi:hypothetical protein